MRIDILTLFPEMFAGPFDASIIKRARDSGLVQIVFRNLREWGLGRHRTVDDYPYGGGAGMVMRPEPLCEAIDATRTEMGGSPRIVLLTPQGRLFSQQVANDLAAEEKLLLVCGHYEGVDERVREHAVTDQISIGDYVLTGGELPAMVVVDAVVRRLPGVLGSEESAGEDSHAQGLLEYPHYTRPPDYRGWTVPEILLSGNHAQIARWRREQMLLRTARQRPDLLAKAELSKEDRRFLAAAGFSLPDCP